MILVLNIIETIKQLHPNILAIGLAFFAIFFNNSNTTYIVHNTTHIYNYPEVKHATLSTMNFNFSPEIQPNYKEVEINEIKTRRTEDIKDLQRKLNEERSSMSKEDRRKNMAKLMESMAEEFSEEPAGKAEVEMHQNIIEDSTFESRTVAEELNAIENEENQNSR